MDSMDIETVLYKPSFYRIKKDDATILIDPETPNWIAVNKEGEEILKLCDGKRMARDIAEKMRRFYSEEEVYRFLKDSLSLEIIGTKQFDIQAYKGRSSYLAPDLLEELWIYVTNRCNLRCSHCLVRGGELVKDELSLDGLKVLLKDATRLGAKRMFFTGGEPFLREDLFELITYATEELELELVILTNGILLDEERIKRLGSNPRLVVQVSLEGPASINN